MLLFSKKKRIKREYDQAIKALQLSLYEVIISTLEDELGRDYSIEKIKNAAAITVNKLGLRPESRPDPLDSNDDLSRSLSEIIELTLAKEAVALILLFSYFFSEKTEEQYLQKAKNLECNDFETIYNLVDIDRTSPAKVREIGSAISNGLHEIATSGIKNIF